MLQHTSPGRVSKTASTGGDYHGQHGGPENSLAAAATAAAAAAAPAASAAASEAEALAVLRGGGIGGVGADVLSSNSEDLFSLGTGNSSSSSGGGGGGGEGGLLSVSAATEERCEDCGRTFAPGRLRSHAKARREIWLRFTT